MQAQRFSINGAHVKKFDGVFLGDTLSGAWQERDTSCLLDRDGVVGTDRKHAIVPRGVELIGVDDPRLIVAHLEKLRKGLGASSASLA